MTIVLYYFTFCFIGIFGAEAIAGSAPFGPLSPPFYAIYGLVYVLLLDRLIRRRVSSWLTVYMAGVIVGYLTESFAAKVMWFGWPNSRLNPLGVLPIPEFPFLALFYHPVFSFSIPVYLARRFLACPLPLKTSPRVDRLLLLWPLFPALNIASMRRGPMYELEMVALDALGFALLVFILARCKPVVDLQLRRWSRTLLSLLLAAAYLFAFFKMPPFGRQTRAFPNAFQVCVSAGFLILLMWMLVKRTPRIAKPDAVPWDPKGFDPAIIFRWSLYALAMIAVGISLAIAAPVVIHLMQKIVFISGMLGGVCIFAYGIFDSISKFTGGPAARQETVGVDR